MDADTVEIGQTYDLAGDDCDIHVRVLSSCPLDPPGRFIVKQVPHGGSSAVSATALRPATVDVDLFGDPVGCACLRCAHIAAGRDGLPRVTPETSGRRYGWPVQQRLASSARSSSDGES